MSMHKRHGYKLVNPFLGLITIRIKFIACPGSRQAVCIPKRARGDVC